MHNRGLSLALGEDGHDRFREALQAVDDRHDPENQPTFASLPIMRPGRITSERRPSFRLSGRLQDSSERATLPQASLACT